MKFIVKSDLGSVLVLMNFQIEKSLKIVKKFDNYYKSIIDFFLKTDCQKGFGLSFGFNQSSNLKKP